MRGEAVSTCCVCGEQFHDDGIFKKHQEQHEFIPEEKPRYRLENCSRCGMIIEFDTAALTPGFEVLHITCRLCSVKR